MESHVCMNINGKVEKNTLNKFCPEFRQKEFLVFESQSQPDSTVLGHSELIYSTANAVYEGLKTSFRLFSFVTHLLETRHMLLCAFVTYINDV